jgi:peptidoglycan hydrolase-like protein with peptidoglycan-binding domain
VIRWIPDDPEGALGDELLRLGDDGQMVKDLQALLVALGYDLGDYGPKGDGIDGEYGSMTKAAVKAFEAANGVSPADGVADVAVINRIKTAAGETLGSVRVTGGTVNIRSAANTDHKPIGTVKAGDVLERTGDDTENWIGIVYDKQAAYISAKYVEVVK